MTTLTTHLTIARDALTQAHHLAMEDVTDATYQLAHGRFTPLVEASATAARIDDLLHLTNRLIQSHGA
jgi:hypothetical protein